MGNRDDRSLAIQRERRFSGLQVVGQAVGHGQERPWLRDPRLAGPERAGGGVGQQVAVAEAGHRSQHCRQLGVHCSERLPAGEVHPEALRQQTGGEFEVLSLK